MALQRWGWRLLYASVSRGRKGADREAEDDDFPSRASEDFGERPDRLKKPVYLVYRRLFCRLLLARRRTHREWEGAVDFGRFRGGTRSAVVSIG